MEAYIIILRPHTKRKRRRVFISKIHLFQEYLYNSVNNQNIVKENRENRNNLFIPVLFLFDARRFHSQVSLLHLPQVFSLSEVFPCPTKSPNVT